MPQKKEIIKNPDTYIQGNVEKLTQIGVVKGNVFIINEKAAVKQRLKSIKGDYFFNWEREQLKLFKKDIKKDKECINIIIKSKRFGYKIKFKVSQNMNPRIFEKFLIETLELPRERHIKELGISIVFTYHLNGQIDPSSDTLSEAGITDGAELNLHIDISVHDPVILEKQRELFSLITTCFCIEPQHPPPKEFFQDREERKERLKSELKILNKKTKKKHNKYIQSVIEEPWFAHLEPLETTELSD